MARIVVVTPAISGSRAGNRVTALRWARLLRRLGHHVSVATEWADRECDVLVALHARRSARSALRFRAAHPDRPLVVALGGTDVYPSLARSALAVRACEAADRIVALQPLAVSALPRRLRAKARVIRQSAEVGAARARRPRRSGFRACVLAHLRPVKDPLLPARAARSLPGSSGIEVLHAGRALSGAMARRAREAEARTPRWRWLGELPRPRALALLRG